MSLRIGIIGLGRIVRHGQFPAYRHAGFDVVAAADISPSAVEFARKEWDLKLVSSSVEEVINSPLVDVIDVTTPPQSHHEIVEMALRAGKHVLCQKPFTLNLEDAQALVALATELNLKLAVNQNSRWSPVNQCIRTFLQEGYIGEPYLATFEYHAQLSYEPWRASLPHMVFLEAMIHQIDLLRFWFGMPTSVYAQETLSKGQGDQAVTVGVISFKFANGLMATLLTDWLNPGNKSSYHARLDGPLGSMQATGQSLQLYSEKFPISGWYEPILEEGEWYPGIGYLPAFAASMQDFLAAIEQDVEPSISGRDNLQTLKLTFAACDSAETGEVVSL